MKKLLSGIVAISAVALTIIGCGLNPLDTDTVAITLALSASTVGAGNSIDITGEVDGGSNPPDITYAITRADGIATTGVTASGTAVTKNKVNLGADAAAQIRTTATACAGVYTLTVSATAGTATSSKTATFTVTGGTTCTGLMEMTGTIANVMGPDTGAFDLVNGVRIPSSGAAASKDLLDQSTAGAGFAGLVGSANGSTFATATAADYTNATASSLATLGATASAASISIATVGSVFVAKLGGSRGYAIVKITRYDATAGASTGANKGEADFVYKHTL